jgi:O-antigen/teichoic acid export membrane protein
MVMALAIGLRWPVSLYTGGLNGLQQQIATNLLTIIFTTLQSIGTVIILYYWEPTISAFFKWQVVVALLQVITYRYSLKIYIGVEVTGKFSFKILKEIWGFAAGMTGITILATILTQLDKIILSRILTLQDFGYYTFAATIAAGIFKLVTPIHTAYYPKFVALVEKKDTASLTKLYHDGSQAMSLLIMPIAITFIFFSHEILSAWSNNSELVERTYILISILMAGNTINGLMNLPYALQLSFGWTNLSLYSNLIAVIILMPTIYFSVILYGPVGAATSWLLLNIGYLIFSVHFMHKKILINEKWHWYLSDILPPTLVLLLIITTFRFTIENIQPASKLIIYLTVIIALSTFAAALSMNKPRALMIEKIRSYFL